jgi:RNA polymerase primary sigma factor
MHRAFAELEQKYQREPSVSEVAELLDVTTEDVESSMRSSGRHISVDAPFVQGEENNLLDVLVSDSQLPPDSGMIRDSLKTEVARALSSLTTKESEVLASYYGLNDSQPLTLEEIGDRYNLTRERVRQIKEKATSKLRAQRQHSSLKAYLG